MADSELDEEQLPLLLSGSTLLTLYPYVIPTDSTLSDSETLSAAHGHDGRSRDLTALDSLAQCLELQPCRPKAMGAIPRSGHTPGLQVPSLVPCQGTCGSNQLGATNRCRYLPLSLFPPFLPLFLPQFNSLKIIGKNKISSSEYNHKKI